MYRQGKQSRGRGDTDGLVWRHAAHRGNQHAVAEELIVTADGGQDQTQRLRAGCGLQLHAKPGKAVLIRKALRIPLARRLQQLPTRGIEARLRPPQVVSRMGTPVTRNGGDRQAIILQLDNLREGGASEKQQQCKQSRNGEWAHAGRSRGGVEDRRERADERVAQAASRCTGKENLVDEIAPAGLS